ncbi:MAG: hypothetical protein J7J92_01315 [Candidatus Aenigmarchaeota archaeon]|nr:hypothetical protein [Candidatus Aenigmarchaeota archaeon]
MGAPYKRTYKHTRRRGSESTVVCTFCGKRVPRFKAFALERGFRISDPIIKRNVDMKHVSTFSQKVYACPSCARHRGIIKIGRSRKSRTRIDKRLPKW